MARPIPPNYCLDHNAHLYLDHLVEWAEETYNKYKDYGKTTQQLSFDPTRQEKRFSYSSPYTNKVYKKTLFNLVWGDIVAYYNRYTDDNVLKWSGYTCMFDCKWTIEPGYVACKGPTRYKDFAHQMFTLSHFPRIKQEYNRSCCDQLYCLFMCVYLPTQVRRLIGAHLLIY